MILNIFGMFGAIDILLSLIILSMFLYLQILLCITKGYMISCALIYSIPCLMFSSASKAYL